MNDRLVSRRQFLGSAAAVAGTAFAGCMGGTSSSSDTITLGILEDRSGNFALVGDPKYKASLLAIEEINENGGINGQQIEVFDPDPQSDNQRYQELTRRAINQENVDALWAGYSSATREAIRPIIDREDQLYFYTTQYEGGVCDQNVFAVGPTARQQLGSVLPYLVEEYGPRIYTIAADYNFGQLSADWVRVLANENGAEVIGEEFIPLSNSQFGSTINRIQEADPDFVMSMLVGANHTSFYEQKASAGLDVPIGTSTAMAQGYEHLRLDPPAMENIYAGVNYMEEIPTERNTEDGGFVDRYFEKFPDAPYLNEEAENNYFSIYMYKQAVEQAGTTDQAEVKAALESGITYEAPEAPAGESIALDGATHHVDHHMWVMRADGEHNVEAVDDRVIPETFLSETVGCDLASEDEENQYTPQDFYEVAG
ncbi:MULTISPECIES: urea ABC transporter substrate-binding protein [unclassified Haloferax]|uniref:urea ABC transporter substrate-binding protein n=1 Tax=unclassified Haloferax TaxID=2625095 RepID=UPI000E24BFCE|nr:MULTISPECIES: urea ABC transporter substrate-binding protein [unclassified Haloferax]RDZ36725.1 urea ABC transporter substrate-binding protein [Haloferax sp. Atlit-24N]RLM37524.1 urea ABC transporter substrate-binding protein [Haloferax sp. Atlit-109R]RLM45463.1 urea ABC transporter substrate-binding protein [Haloferax sp. Atlit-105R]